MTDTVSKEKRSEVMRLVKSANTKPEILVRKFLFKNGLRYRLNDKTLPGKPDLKLTKYKILIFVNGCFWHGHTCKSYQMPKTNVDFWNNKIESNKERDAINRHKLTSLGWHVVYVWECELKSKNKKTTLDNLNDYLKSHNKK